MYYSSYPYGYDPRQLAYVPVRPAYIAMPTPAPAPQRGGAKYPEVDTTRFNASAKRFKQVMSQANLFIGSLTASDDFARRLMSAAQRSDQQEVERLVRSTGVTIKYKLHYTPDGLRIDFSNSNEQNSCCTLRMALSW